jgi:rhamnulokinase
MKQYIAIDIGAAGGRCIVGQIKDKSILLSEVHRFPTHNVSYMDHFHWDILAIYKEIISGLKEASLQFGSAYSGISVDTWGVDYVLLDVNNRILGYPFHYRDNRTDEMIKKSSSIISNYQLYKKTGIQVAQINTLYQLMAEKELKPNMLNIANTLLLTPDFLNFLLSGKKVSEYSIVSTSNLANPKHRNWDWEVIELFGFPKKIFTKVVESGYYLGNILGEVAQSTGLENDTPIISGTGHDTAAAVLSIPVECKNWAFLSSGTWSLMGIETDSPIINKKAFNYNFTNEGGVQGTYRFLKNIVGLWPIQECKRQWTLEDRNITYDGMTELAMKNGPAKAWLDMPQKVISYLKETNQAYKDDVGFIIRCILESLAFKYRTTINEITEVTHKNFDCIHAIGGGIKNELLNQLTADATKMKLITGPVEGTAVGNIGIQAIATKVVNNVDEWRSIVRDSFDVKIYRPEDSRYFNENEKYYLMLMQRKI